MAEQLGVKSRGVAKLLFRPPNDFLQPCLMAISSIDHINMLMLNNVISVLKNPLAAIINKSFQTGKIPDSLKIAKILLFPKSNLNN
jgi:hypothetical protein